MSFGEGVPSHRVDLLPEVRNALSQALHAGERVPDLVLEGRLKAITLCGREPSIVVEDRHKRGHWLRIAKGQLDDTLGPKLNRKVRVLGRRNANEYGEVDDWADDVIAVE